MIIDGKAIAHRLNEQLKTELFSIKQATAPGLAFILIGEDPASHTYVKMKKKACESVGIHSFVLALPEDVTQEALLEKIDSCNQDPRIHGILVQQPLPAHLQAHLILEAIDPFKDVDGFHPLNMGKALLGEETGFLPCTPLAVLTLLKELNISLEGKHLVVIGRSNIVGKPLAAMAVQKKRGLNASVTLVHSHTTNIEEYTRSADILVAALGKPHFVKKEMIKPGAVVIDVGINRIKSSGVMKIVGDVDFEEVKPLCSFITPVPGGVGPMTIAMLLHNTVESFKRLHAL